MMPWKNGAKGRTGRSMSSDLRIRQILRLPPAQSCSGFVCQRLKVTNIRQTSFNCVCYSQVQWVWDSHSCVRDSMDFGGVSPWTHYCLFLYGSLIKSAAGWQFPVYAQLGKCTFITHSKLDLFHQVHFGTLILCIQI